MSFRITESSIERNTTNDIESSIDTESSISYVKVSVMKSSIVAASSLRKNDFADAFSAIVAESPFIPSVNLMKTLNEIESSIVVEVSK